jgi:signal peptidase I
MASEVVSGTQGLHIHPTLEMRLAELREADARKARRQEQIKRERRFLIPVFLFVLFLFPNFGTVSVIGKSMYPTFQTGDRLVMLKSFRIFAPLQPGDVVVLKKREGDLKGEDLIKRVVCIKDNQGNETWAKSVDTAEGAVDPHRLFPGYFLKISTLPNNSVLVLGDNILWSTDSRDPEVGPVAQSEIEGKVLLR